MSKLLQLQFETARHSSSNIMYLSLRSDNIVVILCVWFGFSYKICNTVWHWYFKNNRLNSPSNSKITVIPANNAITIIDITCSFVHFAINCRKKNGTLHCFKSFHFFSFLFTIRHEHWHVHVSQWDPDYIIRCILLEIICTFQSSFERATKHAAYTTNVSLCVCVAHGRNCRKLETT